MNELTNHEYLGDSVYASTDGYHVVLTLNSHDNPPLIYLEPPVMERLISYYKALQDEMIKAARFERKEPTDAT